MSTIAITGKQFTVTVGSTNGSAQITSGSVDESASSETIQTLAGSAAVSQGVESTISADFLYDGSAPDGGFYAVLRAALVAGTPVPVVIDGGGSEWEGDALVTSVGAEFPADGATTCAAELTVSGALTFTPGI